MKRGMKRGRKITLGDNKIVTLKRVTEKVTLTSLKSM